MAFIIYYIFQCWPKHFDARNAIYFLLFVLPGADTFISGWDEVNKCYIGFKKMMAQLLFPV